MNYQFKRNRKGKPLAQFDMGSEAFSHWFSQELGGDKEKIELLRKVVKQLQNKEIKEFALPGKEINLSLDLYEVEVKSTMLSMDAPDDMPEGTELYDQESISGCGLEDFSHVLDSWLDFVSEQ